MNKKRNTRICPVERAGGLDHPVRRLLQNPKRILKPYIRQGMTVVDLGCGPGFFTVEMSKFLMGSGEVIAADLQEGMLNIVRQKIKGTESEKIIKLHKCREDGIGLTVKADFVLAFYMVHEVPDQDKLFKELYSILKPNGRLLIIEPKFHVSKKSFDAMIELLKSNGFEAVTGPKVFFSRTIVLTH
jgi:ubiquinone/menaquinone biosynthesis C-methylase UbiE